MPVSEFPNQLAYMAFVSISFVTRTDMLRVLDR